MHTASLDKQRWTKWRRIEWATHNRKTGWNLRSFIASKSLSFCSCSNAKHKTRNENDELAKRGRSIEKWLRNVKLFRSCFRPKSSSSDNKTINDHKEVAHDGYEFRSFSTSTSVEWDWEQNVCIVSPFTLCYFVCTFFFLSFYAHKRETHYDFVDSMNLSHWDAHE